MCRLGKRIFSGKQQKGFVKSADLYKSLILINAEFEGDGVGKDCLYSITQQRSPSDVTSFFRGWGGFTSTYLSLLYCLFELLVDKKKQPLAALSKFQHL